MNALRLNEKIYWVGKVDDRKVPFHRLILEKGTTYNSYLLMTGKPTVIDTVDIAFGKEYVDNLSQLIDPAEIEYIVINHVEPDHAGALPALAAKAKRAKIVATERGAELLKDMFKLHNREFVVVRDGDTLDIGGKTLKFFETPYLHTEETMITYAQEDEILFTCDIFSTHIANFEIFNDLAREEYLEDFKVYYKLIMAPHRPYVRMMLEKIKGLAVKMIAPSHGYVLREDPARFIALYDAMSSAEEKNLERKVVIVYSTMTGNTGRIADRMAKGMQELGVVSEIYNLSKADLEEVREKVLQSDGVLAGSSTRYADMVGNIEEFLKSLPGEAMKDKFAAAFGSYGWSGEAVVHLDEQLHGLGFTVIDQNYLVKKTGVVEPFFPLRVKFNREEELLQAEEAGMIFAEQLLNQ